MALHDDLLAMLETIDTQGDDFANELRRVATSARKAAEGVPVPDHPPAGGGPAPTPV